MSCSRISSGASALPAALDGRSKDYRLPRLTSTPPRRCVACGLTADGGWRMADGGWRFGAALLERPSSALFNALSPMEMREQLE